MPELRVEVEGHTDSTGPAKYNLELSRRRAEAVLAFLGSRGVPLERLRARGYGEAQPVADNATEGGRRRNRRVDIVISGTG
jgi:outer membrane protein OmpA-like peptidoglycan-associated protein